MMTRQNNLIAPAGDEKTCPICEKPYTPKSVTQKYCSKKCRARAAYLRRTGRMEPDHPERSFRCAKCGMSVHIEAGSPDKRMRFCSARCEKLYWKHRRQQ